MNHESTTTQTFQLVFSAARIAELLTVPPAAVLTPTAEQQRVIEHPLSGSALVVAGAGSGKTETMANRVVWLVANGVVQAEEILGLTFTRKAAGELRERISQRLETFTARLNNEAELGTLSAAEYARAVELTELMSDGAALPDVSTYNAFAAGVLDEFGLAAGVAPGAAVIDEAVAWRIAREIVVNSTDPELVRSDLSLSELVRYVIQLDHAIADNLTTIHQAEQVITEFTRTLDLPYNDAELAGARSGKVYAPVRDAIAKVSRTPLLLRLAHAYADEKRSRGVIEFSDQLALATRTLIASPAACTVLRERYPAVMLDEVQDTSVGQTRFLARMFAGSAVMAVGDPHQSIYGWRGASAQGLQSFHQDFAPRKTERTPAPAAYTLGLSTSWRNPSRVLDVANSIAAPLRADSPFPVSELAPRPGAANGSVQWCYPETLHEEHAAVAQWMKNERQQFLQQYGTLPSAAVIFRKRSAMAAFSAALTAAGVPNQIIGVGGLLTTPEVTEIVTALRCIWYADANNELLRLLSGPRFGIGVADLAGLLHATRWFADRDPKQQKLSDADRAHDAVLPDPDRAFTLLDALDRIAELRNLDHAALRDISEQGRERLREAGTLLAQLRRSIGRNVLDLISEVIYALRIDIELDANETRNHSGSAGAQANLDAFLDLVESFLAVDDNGTLAAVLEWLERATNNDEAAEHIAAPTVGTVQLITVHGSKGLEWDLVAVPRLVHGEFPGTPRTGAGWLRTGELPDELRGDAAARPALDWRISTTQKELRDRITDYAQELKDRHASEERRLAYVACTRAAHKLLLSGSFWAGHTKARQPSIYLLELAEQQLLTEDTAYGDEHTELPVSSAFAEDPSTREELTVQWPFDPLGTRAAQVKRAAARLTAERAQHTDTPDGDIRHNTQHALPEETVQLLIAEHAAQRNALRARDLPTEAPQNSQKDGAAQHSLSASHELADRITASTFHEFLAQPLASERGRLRPIPQRPFTRTRLGNDFHEWVERRATTALGTALTLSGIDPEDTEQLASDPVPELSELITRFEASRWAMLQPIAVEQEITLPFAGRTLICKLDAVYAHTEEQHTRYEIVDWKTGRAPRNDEERRERFLQLDLYRHAYAQWAKVPLEDITVTLFYVAESIELTHTQPKSLSELETLWLEAAAQLNHAAAERGV